MDRCLPAGATFDAMLSLRWPRLSMFILLADDRISRLEGLLLLLLFCLWLTLILKQALTHRREETPAPRRPSVAPLTAWLLMLTGLACLMAAGQLFVIGASGIAAALNVHAYVIGATVSPSASHCRNW